MHTYGLKWYQMVWECVLEVTLLPGFQAQHV